VARQPLSALAQYRRHPWTQPGLARRRIEQVGQEARGQVGAMPLQQLQPFGQQAGRMRAARQQGQ